MPVTWEQHGQLEYFKKSWISKYFQNIYSKILIGGKKGCWVLPLNTSAGISLLKGLIFNLTAMLEAANRRKTKVFMIWLGETLKHQRESPPWFLYNKQNHLNCSARTARKSQSPTGGQVRRSWFYMPRQLLEQQIRTGDRSGQGLGPSLSGPTSSLQHLVSPVPFSL